MHFRLFLLAVLLVSSSVVDAHGVLSRPISRALRLATGNETDGIKIAGSCPGFSCEWYTQQATLPSGQHTTICDPALRTQGVSCASKAPGPVDFPCTEGSAAPWCAPGRAHVKSPCGVFAGGLDRDTRDMLDLPNGPVATWTAGDTAEVGFAMTANHGGGYVYRLCPVDSELSEECFQRHTLPFAGVNQWLIDTKGQVIANLTALRTDKGTWPEGSTWTRNPVPQEKTFAPILALPWAIGRGPFNFTIMDQVIVPEDLPSGHYVLSWRWDAEQTKQGVLLSPTPSQTLTYTPNTTTPQNGLI